MNDEAFNLSVRKFLKHFGVDAQREIEKSVDAAVRSGRLKGTETLKARARLEIQGLPLNLVIEHDITLASRRHADGNARSRRAGLRVRVLVARARSPTRAGGSPGRPHGD